MSILTRIFKQSEIKIGSKWIASSSEDNPFDDELLVYEVADMKRGWVKLRYGLVKYPTQNSISTMKEKQLRNFYVPYTP
jgi:hypothetical protein